MSAVVAILRSLPYPPISGGEQRCQRLFAGLASEFDLEVFVCTPAGEPRRELARDCHPGVRLVFHGERPSERWARQAVRQLTHPGAPMALTRFDLAGLRRHLSSEMSRDPRGVWVDDPLGWWLANSLGWGSRSGIDLKDIPHRFRDRSRWKGSRSGSTHIGLGTMSRLRVERQKWNRVEQAMVRRSALVTVCSDVDRRQLGETANVVVVPNGYERVEVPTEVHDRLPGVPRPRLVIQGSYDYGPNIAAATDFARDILPLVREQIPSATLVLAGKHSDELAAFAGRKDVVATGFVEDMPAMVRSCDVVVVPIRGGSGTRIKILEAWANQIPVVSTELGAEGLGAEHGDELLIAETPEAFAEACVAVLKDREVRGGLVQSATRLFEDRYVWDEIVNDFVSLFRARLDLG